MRKKLKYKFKYLVKRKNINLILLLKDKENSAVSKELSKDIYKNVEIFLKKNMIFNVTKHIYVPQHILLNKEEELELLVPIKLKE